MCQQFVDINQEWEYRKVIGEELIGGVLYYEMKWCTSLIRKSSVLPRAELFSSLKRDEGTQFICYIEHTFT